MRRVCVDYARDTRRLSVLMRRNLFETAHVHVRPLTPHLHITHEPCTYHVHRGTKVLERGTFAKRACLNALRQWFMRRACVECSWNTAPYLVVCVDEKSLTARNETDTCALTHRKRVHVIDPNNFFFERFLTDGHPLFITQTLRAN